jgi:hypothetical protein
VEQRAATTPATAREDQTVTEEKHEDTAEVISLNERRKVSPGVGSRTNHKCRHSAFEIDERTGQVWCASCDALVEPILALIKIMNKETQMVYYDRKLHQEHDRLAESLEELKREERNAKARLRRLKAKL